MRVEDSPASDDADVESALAIHALWRGLERYRKGLALSGVRGNEMVALVFLVMEGPKTLTELSAELGFATPSTTELVDRLQGMGFVQRTPHPTDRRKQLVELTAPAMAGLLDTFRTFSARVRPVYDRFTPEEQRAINEFLYAAAKTLSGATDVTPGSPEALDP